MLRSINDLLQEPALPATPIQRESVFEETLGVDKNVLQDNLFTQVTLVDEDYIDKKSPKRQVRLLFINKKTYLAKPDVVKNLAPIIFVAEYRYINTTCLITGLKSDIQQSLLALCRYNFLVLPAFIRNSYSLGIYGVSLYLPYAGGSCFYIQNGTLPVSALHLVSVIVLGNVYSPHIKYSDTDELRVYMQYGNFASTYRRIVDACTEWDQEVADVN